MGSVCGWASLARGQARVCARRWLCASPSGAGALSREEQMARIKSLRGATGAPVGKVKKALESSGWDEEAARQHLRKAGLAAANKIAGRTAAEGLVALLVAPHGQRAAMVEVNCETDFVSRNERFQGFARAAAHAALHSQVGGDAKGALTELDGVALGTLTEPEAGATLGEAARSLAGELGENVTLRRGVVLDVRPRTGADAGGGATLVRGYVHNVPSNVTDFRLLDGRPDLGEQGTLVALAGAPAGAEGEPEGDDNPPKRAIKVAMHVTAMRPQYLDARSVPQDVLDAEADAALEKFRKTGKDASIVEKMVGASMKKWYTETTLASQPFIMDPKQTVEQYLRSGGQALGLAGMAHFKVGEGVEREERDFAAEVRAAAQG